MAGRRTGTSTILKNARKISRVFHTYGATDLPVIANSAVYAAVAALTVAYDAWAAADDYPGQIDTTAPIEDIDITLPPPA
jgi:hypothetical protein